MATTSKTPRRKKTGGADRFDLLAGAGSWKMPKHASAKSCVLRANEGPQRVSVRGKDAVVVMSVPKALERLMPANPRCRWSRS